MSELILQISTFDILPGMLSAFKEAVRDAIIFAEQEGPQLWVQTYIDERAMSAQSVQIIPGSDAILRHWRQSDPHIHAVMSTCRMRRLDIYGRPSDAVLQGLEPLKAQDVVVAVTPDFFGFKGLRVS